MPLDVVFTQLFLFAHLLIFAGAAAAVVRADLLAWRGLRQRQLDLAGLAQTARPVPWLLAGLWVTGLGLVGLTAGFDLDSIVQNDKLLAKITAVFLLTINGLALHLWAFPALGKSHRNPDRAAIAISALGAASGAGWLFAAALGTARHVAPYLEYMTYLALFLGLALVSLVSALVIVQPRLAVMLARLEEPVAPQASILRNILLPAAAAGAALATLTLAAIVSLPPITPDQRAAFIAWEAQQTAQEAPQSIKKEGDGL